MDRSVRVIKPQRRAPISESCRAKNCPVSERERARERHGERGAGHLKAIVWSLILLALIYIAVKVIPVLVDEYQFQDSIQNVARFASANRQNNEQVKQEVVKVAEKQELPIQPDQIKVEGTSGNVHIHVDYSVTLDLKVYQWTLNFHPAADNSALY
jgi:cell division protein FtsL